MIKFYREDIDGDTVIVEVTSQSSRLYAEAEVVYYKPKKFLGIFGYNKRYEMYHDTKTLDTMVDWEDQDYEDWIDRIMIRYNAGLAKTNRLKVVRKKIKG